MKGIGKTVVSGNEIQTFEVTVVDVIDNVGVLNDHIVVRLDGAAIRRSGGVAAGMSGSPIYLNNKLAGALWGTWGFQVGAQPIALVRPIETMLTMVSALKKKASERLARRAFVPYGPLGTITLDGERKRIEIVSEPPREPRPDTIFVRPVATPLLVSGVRGRAVEWLRSGVSERSLRSVGSWLLPLRQEDFLEDIAQGLEERYEVRVRPTGLSGAAARAAYYQKDPIPIVEGGPVGVMLTEGDITLGAFGTVSYVEEDVVLAFGHWFFPAGETEFFLTEALILDTVEALDMPFKLGVSGRTVGAIFEDRWQGVGGLMEVQPRSFDVNLSVHDRDLKTTNRVRFRVAYYESTMPLLLLVSALETVDQTLNRVGPGTMVVRYTIQGDDLPQPLARTDVFASFSDIAVTGPLRVAQMLFLLARNEFQDARFTRIDVEIEVEKAVRALRVRELKTDKEKYKPGETV
ncbi:MAG: SpoIVB peptidase S55 domain-containing protein, partial [Candidatus Bipolaricaulota bacterium]|nr:SpoIVB peptidase S55 domain-containing protein [Candidatus Bipolaricaulota bacterium]